MSPDDVSPAHPLVVKHVASLLLGSDGPAWDEEDISAALRGGATVRHGRCAIGGSFCDALSDALVVCGLPHGQGVHGAVALLQVATSDSIHRIHRVFMGAMIDRFGPHANCLAVARRIDAADPRPILSLWISGVEKL